MSKIVVFFVLGLTLFFSVSAHADSRQFCTLASQIESRTALMQRDFVFEIKCIEGYKYLVVSPFGQYDTKPSVTQMFDIVGISRPMMCECPKK